MDLINVAELEQWFMNLKSFIHQCTSMALIKVNDKILRLYWDLDARYCWLETERQINYNIYKYMKANETKVEDFLSSIK